MSDALPRNITLIGRLKKERYAAALMGEVNLPRLRTIAAKTEMSLARIDRSRLFYLNFDRSPLDQDEIDTLLPSSAA